MVHNTKYFMYTTSLEGAWNDGSNIQTVTTGCMKILGLCRVIIAQMLTAIPFEIKRELYEMIHEAQHPRDN